MKSRIPWEAIKQGEISVPSKVFLLSSDPVLASGAIVSIFVSAPLFLFTFSKLIHVFFIKSQKIACSRN